MQQAKRLSFLVSLGLCFCHSSLNASTEEHSTDNGIENILVTGVKPAAEDQTFQVDTTTYTGFSRIIDRSEFVDRYTPLTELLNQLPGIQTFEAGGTGSYSTTSIRGSTGKQVSFFLDGMLLNSPSSGNANIQFLPTAVIERIEAYPDFTPAELGNANLAGAVQFISRTFDKHEKGGELILSHGSFNNQHAELSGWSDINNWQTLAAVSYTDAQNNYPVDDDLFATSSDERINDEFTESSVLVKTSREFSQAKLSFMLQGSDTTKGIPTQLNRLVDNAKLDEKNIRLQSGVSYKVSGWNIGHRLYFSKEKTLFTDLNSTVGLNANKDETHIDNIGLFQLAKLNTETQRITFTLDASQDDIEQFDQLNNKIQVDARRNNLVLAIADEWHASENTSLLASVRQYRVEDTIDQAEKDYQASSDINASAYHLGAQWQFTKNWLLKINTGNNIRIPTLVEKFGRTGLYEGDPELKHERAHVFDTGLLYSTPTAKISATLFSRKVTDGIYTIYDSRGIGHPENIGESEIQGIEGQLFLTPVRWFELSADATLMDSKNLSNIKSARNNKMPGIYHYSAGSSIAWIGENNRLNLSYQYQDEFFYNAANSIKADPIKALSCSFTHYWQSITVDITARNLTDKHFQSFYMLPMPGRSFTATFTYIF